MGWVAKRRMKISRNGKVIDVLPGDPIHEAEHWATLKACVRTGFLRWVPDRPELSESPASEPVTIGMKLSVPYTEPAKSAPSLHEALKSAFGANSGRGRRRKG